MYKTSYVLIDIITELNCYLPYNVDPFKVTFCLVQFITVVRKVEV